MTEIQVTAVVKYRNPFSGNFFTKLMPMTAPISTYLWMSILAPMKTSNTLTPTF